jgi:hypothetical protein
MWKDQFIERELKEIDYCLVFQQYFNHGTDEHNIRLIVAKLATLLSERELPDMGKVNTQSEIGIWADV